MVLRRGRFVSVVNMKKDPKGGHFLRGVQYLNPDIRHHMLAVSFGDAVVLCGGAVHSGGYMWRMLRTGFVRVGGVIGYLRCRRLCFWCMVVADLSDKTRSFRDNGSRRPWCDPRVGFRYEKRPRMGSFFHIKNQSPEVVTSGVSGAATRIRTGDLILTKDVLYQLSHSSMSKDISS